MYKPPYNTPTYPHRAEALIWIYCSVYSSRKPVYKDVH